MHPTQVLITHLVTHPTQIIQSVLMEAQQHQH